MTDEKRMSVIVYSKKQLITAFRIADNIPYEMTIILRRRNKLLLGLGGDTIFKLIPHAQTHEAVQKIKKIKECDLLY